MLCLASMAAHRLGVHPGKNLHGLTVAPAELTRLARTLREAERERRLRLKGMDAKRVDLIYAGAAVADHVLRGIRASSLTACTWALREGILVDYIQRHGRGIEESARFADVRRRSVARLIRRLGYNGTHHGHVARLSLRLFDQLRDRLGVDEGHRELLEYAALLHDVGHLITNEVGFYSAPYLAIGRYTVTAKLDGFQTVVREAVQVSLNDTRVLHFEQKPSGVAETVTVTGEAPRVNSTNAEVKGVLTEDQIIDKPALNPGSFLNLAEIFPGFQENPTSGQNNPTASSGSSINFNGTAFARGHVSDQRRQQRRLVGEPEPPGSEPRLDQGVPGHQQHVQRGVRPRLRRGDEAMNDLTILATGLYGMEMPNQNGAPLRLVVPWKYGFKSIKAITRIELLEEQPETLWKSASPDEYGFYSNVNPNRPHPRWSQSTERRIGEFNRRETLMFNGYSEQVAEMYKDMVMNVYY